MKLIFLSILIFFISIQVFSQNDYDKQIPALVKDTSYRNWAGKYRHRSYFLNGKKQRVSKCNLFNVLHGKTWNEQGKLISKTKQHPFPSTSYIIVTREKTYNQKGVLIKYEYEKKSVSCFGGKIKRSKIIEYNDEGKRVPQKKHTEEKHTETKKIKAQW
ncbi:MAG TPA: hypothetical protein VKG26_14765 [Bacteroidia bacterium]|nr:hypothetical protein [Bacteroidia bacterium]